MAVPSLSVREWRFLKGFTGIKPPVREANLYEFARVAIVGIDTTNRGELKGGGIKGGGIKGVRYAL